MVLTISLIAFLMLLLVSLSVVLKVETGAGSSQQKVAMARQNALLGLETSIGQLQQFAGPDQRVTATADILAGNGTVAFPHWTGVWKRKTPLTKNGAIPDWQSDDAQHLTWLVSGNSKTDPLAFGMNSTLPANSTVLCKSSAGNATVTVPQEEVGQINSKGYPEGHFAFWVADESVKARVNIGNTTNSTSSNATAVNAINQWIAAPPGIGKLDAFKTLSPSPETPASGQPNLWNRLTSTDQITLANSNASASVVKDLFHDVTTSSAGLFTDTQFGGLKKDLSLAFEMTDADFDGDPFFAGNAATSYKNNTGNTPSSPVPALSKYTELFYPSFVYTTPGPAGGPSGRTVYGPTWHRLRDYYRQYLRITSASSSPSVPAEAVPVHIDPAAPNPNTIAVQVSEFYTLNGGHSGRDVRTSDGAPGGVDYGAMRFRPTKSMLSPVITQVAYVLSLTDRAAVAPLTGRQLGLVVDALVSIWNPYNVALTMDSVQVQTTMPTLNVTVTGVTVTPVPSGNSTTQYGPENLLVLAGTGDGSTTPAGGLRMFLNTSGSFTLAPGEVRVFGSSKKSVGKNEPV